MDITFFAWADTHFGYEPYGDGVDYRAAIIDQLHQLPGQPYPDWVGGHVAQPQFVVHLGDIVDGHRDGEAEFTAFRRAMQSFSLPRVELLGNHDHAEVVHNHVVQRHGGCSYHFDVDGIRFVALHLDYDKRGSEYVSNAQLAWLRDVLDRTPAHTSIVLFTHVHIMRLPNADALLKLLGGHRVILNIGGHIHKPSVIGHGSFPCLTVGHCRDHPIDPRFGRSFHVVRITDDRLLALAWRWDENGWECGNGWTDPQVALRQVTIDELLPAAAARLDLNTEGDR